MRPRGARSTAHVQALSRSSSMDLPLPSAHWLDAAPVVAGTGVEDICRAPALSLAHGMVLALLGALILLVGHNRFWLMAGALSGFLVVGPVVATSLYAMSRALERGEAVNLGLVRRTWSHWQQGHEQAAATTIGAWCSLACLLAVSATGWVVISASLITLLSPVRIASPHGLHAARGAGGGRQSVLSVAGFGQPFGGAYLRVQRGFYAFVAGSQGVLCRRRCSLAGW